MKGIAAFIALVSLGGCAGTGGFVDQSTQRHQPVAVTTLMLKAPNSAGGVGFYMDFTNTSGKTIKYAEFGLTPFNAVGDVVTSSVSHQSLETVKYTGPFAPGVSTDDFAVTFNGGTVGFSNVWYNSDITCVQLDLVRITFTDGTTKVVEGNAAHELVAPSLRKNCASLL